MTGQDPLKTCPCTLQYRGASGATLWPIAGTWGPKFKRRSNCSFRNIKLGINQQHPLSYKLISIFKFMTVGNSWLLNLGLRSNLSFFALKFLTGRRWNKGIIAIGGREFMAHVHVTYQSLKSNIGSIKSSWLNKGNDFVKTVSRVPIKCTLLLLIFAWS